MSKVEPPAFSLEFDDLLGRQPYTVQMDDLEIRVDKDVFPPDWGLCARNLGRICPQYGPRTALDMGCGTGYVALMLKRGGADQVWAVDVHWPAVACARENSARNSHLGPIQVVQSDLFDLLPTKLRFDLIVFNQPFGPGTEERPCGCGPDGGYAICKRFLQQAPLYLADGGVLIMPFSDRESEQNSPRAAALEMGYSVVTRLHRYYDEANNFIFEIRLS